MSVFKQAWYLIYTKPRYEQRVEECLVRNKIKCFLPKHKVVQRSSQKKIVTKPLFPSYVFIYPENLREYYYGIDIEGSVGYVRVGKELAKVNDDVIDNIKVIQSLGLEMEVTSTNFSVGEKVKISLGVFQGIECEFVSYKNKKMGLIRLMPQNLLITLPINNLAASG